VGDNSYKKRHKEQGLCVDCSRPSLPNNTRCAVHSYFHSVTNKNFYNKNREKEIIRHRKAVLQYKENNRCPRCSAPLDEDADNGYITCVNCRGRI